MLRSLRTRKGREESGLFLVEGVRLCEEMLAAGWCAEMALLAKGSGAGERARETAERLAAAGVPLFEAPGPVFERISDTVNSQGILAAVRARDLPLEQVHFAERAVALALDGVADPGNVGTVIRTAAWFGVSVVLLGRGCADLFNPKTVRSTMGGIFHVPVCRNPDLPKALARLKSMGFSLTAAAMDGSSDWSAWAGAPRSALVLGSEAHGVSAEVLRLADQRVTIPRRGKGDSLNVAVAAGILLSGIQP